MGFTRYLHKDCNFLLTVVSGYLDRNKLHENISDFNLLVKGIPHLKELAICLDIDNLKDLTVHETVTTSRVEDERLDSLLAILVPDSDPLAFGMARSYCAWAETIRKDAEVFTDYHKALIWLAEDEQQLATFQYHAATSASLFQQIESQDIHTLELHPNNLDK